MHPILPLPEGTTQEGMDEQRAASTSNDIYGPEERASLFEDSKKLARLIAKEAIKTEWQFTPNKEEIDKIEHLVAAAGGHSGASFTVVRGVAYRYGVGVTGAYNTAFPGLEEHMLERQRMGEDREKTIRNRMSTLVHRLTETK